MDAEREAKRKVFQEILEMAKGGMSETLKAKSPKFKAAAEKAAIPKGEEKCADCEAGDCEEHDAEGFKSKLAALYEKMTED